MALSFEDFEQLQPPNNIEDLGVPEGVVEDLFMRMLFNFRNSTVSEVAEAIGLSYVCGFKVAKNLQEKKLVEYQGAVGRDYRITLTGQGFNTTSERLSQGRHIGHVPISVQQYQTLVELQAVDYLITRKEIHEALSELILEDSIVDQVGPALANRGAILIYGPPGTGKTVMSQQLVNIFSDYVAIPRYIETEGQIISVYDPSIHVAADEQPEQLDPRFVLCQRPLVLVGGELTLDSLELQFDQVSGISMAPIQMMANNGILVVDDFGRQSFSPDRLLNRWILPFSSGVDYLRCKTGSKVAIPFEMKMVFSTNLDPKGLGDEAFLRRLPHKVFVGACSKVGFDWIVANSAERIGITLAEGASDHIASLSEKHVGELRPYIAVDMCAMAKSIAHYYGWDRPIDKDTLERAEQMYFVKDNESFAAPSYKPQNAPNWGEPASAPVSGPGALPATVEEPTNAQPVGAVDRRRS